jgi:hypothetical protein
MFAEFTSHAPVVIFRADPHAGAVAVRAGNPDVTRSGPRRFLIIEKEKIVAIRLGRGGWGRKFAA